MGYEVAAYILNRQRAAPNVHTTLWLFVEFIMLKKVVGVTSIENFL